MREQEKWKIWYLSCIEWKINNGYPEPLYNIKYAESNDGINWKRNGTVAIELKKDEGGIASASVLKEGNIYKMWYSYRGIFNYRTNKNSSYRIGYAESKDGIKWVRKDHLASIGLSKTGWDSEMIAYPHVFKNNGRKHMLYNGNGFGKSGFGYAIMK
jgi:hypothetical protein